MRITKLKKGYRINLSDSEMHLLRKSTLKVSNRILKWGTTAMV